MTYLINTNLSNQFRCKYAAEKSGLKVEFRKHPMPKDFSDPDQELYVPEALIGVYGSIYTNEDCNTDHSLFWDMWDKYGT